MTDTIREGKLTDLQSDDHNANQGTPRGRYALNDSLRDLGAGRSILLDKHGKIIAGNKTRDGALEVGMEDVIIVPTDGTKIVAVQRTDLDLDADPKARQLALADNRVAELDLQWNVEELANEINAGVDVSSLWHPEEIEKLIDEASALSKQAAEGGATWQPGNPIINYNIIFDTAEQQERFHAFVKWLKAAYAAETLADSLDQYLLTLPQLMPALPAEEE